jgi:hypothetical protein
MGDEVGCESEEPYREAVARQVIITLRMPRVLEPLAARYLLTFPCGEFVEHLIFFCPAGIHALIRAQSLLND